MKLTSQFTILTAFALAVTACNKQPNATVDSAGSATVFDGAGVSLRPGAEWKQIGKGSFTGVAPPGVCLPTLAGKAGLIQVLLLPTDRSEPQIAASGVRAAFDANPKSIKDSFRQESLTVQSGASVVYVTYSQQGEAGAPEGRSHNYIVKNRAGRGVAINYVTNARAESDTAHQMIRETLKVE